MVNQLIECITMVLIALIRLYDTEIITQNQLVQATEHKIRFLLQNLDKVECQNELSNIRAVLSELYTRLPENLQLHSYEHAI